MKKPAIILKHHEYPNRQADERTMKIAFGLDPKEKWPAIGMAIREVQGVKVYVRPLPPANGKRRRFSIRTRAICPVCGLEFAAGRLNQHYVVHVKD